MPSFKNSMDEITEVIVIEDDDLEEGEISDDSITELVVTKSAKLKERKLPRRYTLQEKKISNGKHKKDCKHTRHPHTVKDKLKTSPILNKKHKSSCQRHKFSTGKLNSTKNKPPIFNLTKHPHHENSSYPHLLSAFKNFTSPPRPVSKLKRPTPNDHHDSDNGDSYPKLLLEYKKSREHLNHKRKSSDFDDQIEQSLPYSETNRPLNDRISISNSETKQPSEAKQPLNEKIPASLSAQNLHNACLPDKIINGEESEDEEELRRIALATCVKRTMARKKGSENISNISVNDFASHSLSNQSSVISGIDCDNRSSDNYEVVDMDIDEENIIENVNENVFIIDKNPTMSSEFKQDLFIESYPSHNNMPIQNFHLPSSENEVHLSSSHSQSNQDFEEALLRAELIACMNSKLKTQSVPNPPSCVPVKFPELTNSVECILQQKRVIKTPPVYSKGQLSNSINTSIKRTDVVKLNNSKLPNTKKVIPTPRNINATQERLIITLNNDSSSSSDESDDVEEPSKTSNQENVVASIDALISDARQKSDIKANGTNLNNVSCLSKAQQEEYKKLRNLLAEKEPMLTTTQIVKEKSIADDQNLISLTTEMSKAIEDYEKKTKLMKNAEELAKSKKQMYIASKLKYQHLLEQLHAAKLDKNSNLKKWKLYEAQLVNYKSAVSNQKVKIDSLKTQYTSRRSQLQHILSSPNVL